MATYFVSGHTDITLSEFNQYYEKAMLKLIIEGHSFIMSDEPGCSTMARELLFKHFDVKSLGLTWRVTVYTTGEKKPCLKHFDTSNGHATDDERDATMTQLSDNDLAWVRPGRERENCSVVNNLKRRWWNTMCPMTDTPPT